MRIPRLIATILTAGLLLPVLAQSPTSGDPRERKKAAEELGKQGSTAIPTLEPLLKDPDLEVRIEAVKSIVTIGTQHSLDPLLIAIQDNDPEIQIRATEGLVNFYVPGYIERGITGSLRRVGRSIRGRFTDVHDVVIPPYVNVRPEIIEALGKVARGGASLEARANAARAVGVLRGQAAVPDLVEAIRNVKDDNVIFETLVAFQKIRDKSVAPQIAFLLRDPQKRIQIRAIETTGLLQNEEAVNDLNQVFQRSRDRDVRRAALTALAMIPVERNRELFRSHLGDRDAGLRGASAEGLGRIGNTADLELIERAFETEKDRSPRLSMAFAQVKLGKKELSQFSPLRYLIDSLNSGSFAGVARPFLIELARDPEVRATLNSNATGGTSAEKIGIAQVLAVSGDRDSVPPLEILSRDTDSRVAQEALRALQTLKPSL